MAWHLGRPVKYGNRPTAILIVEQAFKKWTRARPDEEGNIDWAREMLNLDKLTIDQLRAVEFLVTHANEKVKDNA